MAGRGRGIPRRNENSNEPLRRPGIKPAPKESSDEVVISEKLEQLNLANYVELRSPPSVTVLTQNIKDQVASVKDLKIMAATVVQFGVQGRQQASIAAQLVQELRPYNYEDSKFLVEFLNNLQHYFDAKDFSNKTKFLGYLTLLCETYHFLGHEGRNPISFLKAFILECLRNLLASGSEQEISTFVELVLKLCTDLTDSDWTDIMIHVRKTIITCRISEKSRSSLLQLFELYLREWKVLSKNVNELYNSCK